VFIGRNSTSTLVEVIASWLGGGGSFFVARCCDQSRVVLVTPHAIEGLFFCFKKKTYYPKPKPKPIFFFLPNIATIDNHPKVSDCHVL
jgi:hypothetical protein